MHEGLSVITRNRPTLRAWYTMDMEMVPIVTLDLSTERQQVATTRRAVYVLGSNPRLNLAWLGA